MIEILILINLCRKIGANAEAKGHKSGYYKLLLVLFWFAAEIGPASRSLYLAFSRRRSGADGFLIWIGAIAGAALGAWGAFKIVSSLPDLTRDDSEEDYDDYEDDRIAPRVAPPSNPAESADRAATRVNPGSSSPNGTNCGFRSLMALAADAHPTHRI